MQNVDLPAMLLPRLLYVIVYATRRNGRSTAARGSGRKAGCGSEGTDGRTKYVKEAELTREVLLESK
jgi:hypothetical protein